MRTPLKRLSKEQRLRVYQEALRTFRIMAGQKAHAEHVTGMCEHICRAIRKLRFDRYDTELCRKNFPEYFSYKPSSFWREPGGWMSEYWWSTKTPRGRERRLRVMEAIAAGKDKSMTGPLP